jgi:hypothetical protein
MIQKILNLNGVQKLSKTQQNTVKGGRIMGGVTCFEVTCTFSDGFSWLGSTNSESAVSSMESHCSSSGGESQTVDNCIA